MDFPKYKKERAEDRDIRLPHVQDFFAAGLPAGSSKVTGLRGVP